MESMNTRCKVATIQQFTGPRPDRLPLWMWERQCHAARELARKQGYVFDYNGRAIAKFVRNEKGVRFVRGKRILSEAKIARDRAASFAYSRQG